MHADHDCGYWPSQTGVASQAWRIPLRSMRQVNIESSGQPRQAILAPQSMWLNSMGGLCSAVMWTGFSGNLVMIASATPLEMEADAISLHLNESGRLPLTVKDTERHSRLIAAVDALRSAPGR